MDTNSISAMKNANGEANEQSECASVNADELHWLKNRNAELLEALQAMLDAQSARRHPLGSPDEGIATICADAAAKARAAIAKATGNT